jgi:hypothetical protein
MLLTAFFMATLVMFVFEVFIVHSLTKPVRLWIFSHPGIAAVLEFGLSCLMLLFTGVGSIVGLANIASSIPFDIYLFTARLWHKERAITCWGKVFWFIRVPTIVVISREEFDRIMQKRDKLKAARRATQRKFVLRDGTEVNVR